MKKGIAIILACSMVISLCGCCLNHDWKDATCAEPKTCANCGKTEGEPLGHKWADATCTDAKTCTVCGETEGEPLGHNWKAATCQQAKTCTRCGIQEGGLGDHSWKDATCQQAKTCTRCGIQEGGLGDHSWKDATCLEPKVCSVCGNTEGEPLGHEWVNASYASPKHCNRCEEKEGKRLKLSGPALVSALKKQGYKTTTVTDSWGTFFALVLPVSEDSFLLDLDMKSFYARTMPQVLTVNEWAFMRGNRWTYNTEPTTLPYEDMKNEIIDLAICIAEILGEPLSEDDIAVGRTSIGNWNVETYGVKYQVTASDLVVRIKD